MHFSKNTLMLLASSTGIASGAAVGPFFPHGKPAPGTPILANKPYPNTTYGGITVIDTPIVRLAQEYTRNHSTEAVFKHQMRSWLYGSLIINANETLKNSVDIEVQAVGALLHDLGWDTSPNSPVYTLDHRFEIDGAIAARKFIEKYGDENWDARRTQLVWDAIALHTTRTISYFKEFEVATIGMGIAVDYDKEGAGITTQDFNNIVAAFPDDDLKKATNDTFIYFCATKPAQTYDNQLQPWGERYVANYSTVGNLRIDNIFKKL
ncbi:uncharacterized protein GGS22DRAFT_158577 [Annulohypoxylon maeteangense]|uniref:uncharacterized protein n=1 Tax=Annulohypoxylon maeteangense TaxID=1927788 RepID=UPI0020074867|nr:uncharacterized protein GGS22DRAFT_158577 [Annulohypoxylon maeteangense]KAI0886738.1 hypothetical protein GGS22DRAFT_158577 [Annulohypoxylon maeteangense]